MCMQETQEGENACFRYGVAAMQGWRVTMVRFRILFSCIWLYQIRAAQLVVV